ncbi:hypothetical protein RDV89_06640 [Nocardioides zeae]|uniref:Uncharacterized protein n=1 Tax=Nocardioides imazamoxiresistens TaxID=3231893 RepID=A0ABU3PU64_9ACTN|nr:hypothetical protein [Nocardioides zeae]MDT9592736.1 hypothetical protein [Nocardioides zeae]
MPRRLSLRTSLRVPAALALTAAAALVVLAPTPPAQAAARVAVANPDGDAVVDATYATTLQLRGSGFQSVQGGHGGVYVFFGTVSDGWRPSQGGRTGADYFYVPDSESGDNQGFQRYVAFPGSDTASSANGGTVAADGTWSTSVVVPGARFTAVDRSGAARTVDCREVTCGIITIGAHGVSNRTNETFTPVAVADLYSEEQPAAGTSGGAGSTGSTGSSGAGSAGSGQAAAPTGQQPDAAQPAVAGPALLEVDRGSAVAGRVLPFTASGLPAGRQVSVTFDDGAAGAGPFQVGSDGTLAGVITLPADTPAGTHELRVFGLDEPVTVSFAVQASDAPATSDDTEQAAASDESGTDWLAVAFVVAAGLVLLGAVLRLVLARRGGTRSPGAGGVVA